MSKHHIKDWAISWTADHEQYWQGHGIATTDYTHCATGCGESLRDAFEDAIEDLAQQGVIVTVFDGDAMLDDLRAQCSGDLKEPLDATVTDVYCDADDEDRADENHDCAVCAGEWHFYVSIDVIVTDGDQYEVVVGNIGSVYSGNDLEEATKHYAEYVGQSRLGYGRAANEGVTLLANGEIKREHYGEVQP